jgi:DNA-binding transcriptional regulator YiaG
MLDVKAIREKTGLNMKDFADYFIIPYRTYQNWESGTRPIPVYVYHLLDLAVANDLANGYDFKEILRMARGE